MATRIRLKRLGAKHDPHYRIVVADSRRQRDSSAIEELGYYTPGGGQKDFKINVERARYWLSVGAQPTDTVRSLLCKAGVIDSEVEGSEAAETTAATEEVTGDEADDEADAE